MLKGGKRGKKERKKRNKIARQLVQNEREKTPRQDEGKREREKESVCVCVSPCVCKSVCVFIRKIAHSLQQSSMLFQADD